MALPVRLRGAACSKLVAYLGRDLAQLTATPGPSDLLYGFRRLPKTTETTLLP